MTAGIDHDKIVVSTGVADLSHATLQVNVGYTPQLGDTITLLSAPAITGMFSQVTFPPAPAGTMWRVTYTTTSVIVSLAAANPPTDILLSGNTVSENAMNGTVVGTLLGVDPDAGDSFTYSIVDGAGGRFVVQGNQLKVADGFKLNFETQASHSITVQVRDSNGLTFNKQFTIQLLNRFELQAFDVQKGDLQRSYIRNVDLVFDDPTAVQSLLARNAVQLTRFNLNGSNPSAVSLTGRMTRNGAALAIDFGIQGIGGNRNSNLGDGYYQLKLDLDGDGAFETIRSFYRIFGDTDGNRIVNQADLDAINAAMAAGTKLSPVARRNADINGDGVLNALDRFYRTQELNRKLLNGLWIDD